MNVQQVLAALVFALCVALLVHHLLGARRQATLRMWWTMRIGPARRWWASWWAHRRRQAQQRAWRKSQARPPRPPQQPSRPTRRDAVDPRGSAATDRGDALDDTAAREAADLIERARRQGANGGAKGGGEAGGGKVVRPPRFGNRRNDLH